MSSGELGGSLTINPQDAWTNFLNTRITQIEGVSPRDRPDVVQYARQKIDDEEAALLAVIPSLRARRNALSLISSLPFEILGHVFHFHATNEPPAGAGSLGWIQATHVCRFWRETALQTPSLWSDVTDRLGQKWTKEMLSRAKSAPISYLQCTPARPPSSSIAGHVLSEQLFRIRHLSITEPTRDMNAILQSMSLYSAPILESVYLKDAMALVSGWRTLPSDIFNTHSPMLRRLELQGFQIPWSTPILRGLVHLHIDNNFDTGPRDAPATDGDVTVYSQFFSALREMSALETLFLSHCLPVEPRSPPSIQTVMLPRVEKLTLGGEFLTESKNILKHLTMPPSCNVTIECEDLDPRPFPFPGTFSFVKAHVLSLANELPFLTMFLSTTTLPERRGSSYDPQWKLRFWAVGGVPDLAGLRQDWEDAPSISILVDRWTDNVYTNVRALCECSPKDIIRDLIIESDGALEWTLTPEEWLHVFGEYMEVENISVMGQVARSFCRALGLSTGPLTSWEQAVGQSEDDSPLSQEGLFLGKLKRVELKQVNFCFHFDYMRDVFEDDEVGGDYPTISNGIHTLLKTSLSRRRAASDTRLTLFIRQCSIDSDQIRELQDIAEVDWDDVTDPAPTINEGGLD